MFKVRPLAVRGAALLLVTAVSAASALADTVESRLIGAWTLYVSDCPKLFEPGREGAVSFRQPTDQFAQAIIIQPDQILGPAAVCRINSISHDSSGTTLGLGCRDSISFLSRTVHVKFQGANQIVYSPSNDPALDTTYTKCPF
jgi:hypothetical protein